MVSVFLVHYKLKEYRSAFDRPGYTTCWQTKTQWWVMRKKKTIMCNTNKRITMIDIVEVKTLKITSRPLHTQYCKIVTKNNNTELNSMGYTGMEPKHFGNISKDYSLLESYKSLTMHLSHCRPNTFSLHWHCPVSLLQTPDTDPLAWHWQTEREEERLENIRFSYQLKSAFRLADFFMSTCISKYW